MKRFLLVICIVSLVFLNSCMRFKNNGNSSKKLIKQDINIEVPYGDANLKYDTIINLFLPKKNTYKLNKLRKQINLSVSDISYEQIVTEILEFKGNDIYESPTYGVNIGLYGEYPVEIYENSAIVNLSPNALRLEKNQFYLLSCCISETLMDFAGFQSVSILVADKAVSIDSFSHIPIAAIEKSNNDSPYAEFIKLKESHDSQSVQSFDINLNLFFPASSGNGVLAENRKVVFSDYDSSNMINQILIELSNGSRFLKNNITLPSLEDLQTVKPEVTQSKDGGNIVILRFKSIFNDVFETTKVNKNTVIAMICHSIIDFYPDISGIKIFIGSELLTTLESDGISKDSIDIENGIFTKKILNKYIMKQMPLYFSNIDATRLVKSVRVLNNNIRISPRNILLEIAHGPKASDHILYPTIPTIPFQINDHEILGISLQDSMLVINFSDSVLEKIKGLDTDSEKIFIYSIVNTLCDSKIIKSVLFRFNSQSIDYVNGDYYWYSEFYPNFKLI